MTTHKPAPSPWPGNPWLIYFTDGHATPCVDGDDWLAEWRRRVCKIELGGGTPQQRCAELDRLLTANAFSFRIIIQYGSVVAVLDATEAVIKADMRLLKAIGAPVESNRKLDRGAGDHIPALRWHPWPAEPGASRAAGSFNAAYVARPNPAGGFDLYRGGLCLRIECDAKEYKAEAQLFERYMHKMLRGK